MPISKEPLPTPIAAVLILSHSEKVYALRAPIDAGTEIDVSPVFSKEFEPNVLSLEGSVIFVRAASPLKAYSPIDVTAEGMLIVSKAVH